MDTEDKNIRINSIGSQYELISLETNCNWGNPLVG